MNNKDNITLDDVLIEYEAVMRERSYVRVSFVLNDIQHDVDIDVEEFNYDRNKDIYDEEGNIYIELSTWSLETLMKNARCVFVYRI